MQSESLVYSNARVKSLENSFLSQEKINRMVYADSLDEAVRVLLESNYGNGIVASAFDFDLILNAEEQKLNDFMSENTIPKMGLETFLVKNDYHNAKAICKAKYMHSDDVSYMVAPEGKISIDYLQEKIFNDTYDSLPKPMAQALLKIDNDRVMGDTNPSSIDIALDKAMYEDILDSLKSSKAASIKQYWQANIDFGNISLFIRYKKIGFSQKQFEASLIDGGKLDKNLFVSYYDQVADLFIEKLKYTCYEKLVNTIDLNNLVSFETECDNYLLNIFKENKQDVFSVAPLAGFYVAKKMEIKVCRMILILKKNKIDSNIIKQRLRDYYA